MIDFNYHNEIVSSPTTIVSGRVSNVVEGVIQFTNNLDEVFPTQFFEINNGQFKAIVHVSPGEPNRFDVKAFDGGHLNYYGNVQNLGSAVDKGTFTLSYNPLPENKPLFLCVLVGSDSKGVYDMPRYKLENGEVANLDTAIQRLKVAGRLMQAYTQDEFRQIGLSNRSFQFDEETVGDKQVFGYEFTGAPHSEVKVHVLRSPLTVQELRNPDYAQQNPQAKEDGFLFSHCLDLISQSDLTAPYEELGVPIQCAVMILDSTWNHDYITAHAALGGGNGTVKLAIFGSHGLHSYPLTFSQVTGSFLDRTALSTREVANDCGECSLSWQCLNICMGAFMHEIGHLFGSPHQVDGVMLRDYVYWNRLFMTREAPVFSSEDLLIGANGQFLMQCHWSKLDLIRYLYHGSFSLPNDVHDSGFKKLAESRMKKSHGEPVPTIYVTEPGLVVVKSEAGIYMFELCADEVAEYSMPFFPKCYGGVGPQNEIKLNFDECLHIMRTKWERSATNFSLRVLSAAGDLYIRNFKEACFPSTDKVITSDFNLNRGLIDGYMSELLGRESGDLRYIGFDIERVFMIRVYHGGAIDGISVYCRPVSSSLQTPPPVPKRNYLKNLMSSQSSQGNAEIFTLGSVILTFSDFYLEEGEKIEKLLVRNGAWVDAVQFVTNRGRSSDMFGNTTGGHLSVLQPPSAQHSIVGFYGYQGAWTDGFGIVYAEI